MATRGQTEKCERMRKRNDFTDVQALWRASTECSVYTQNCKSRATHFSLTQYRSVTYGIYYDFISIIALERVYNWMILKNVIYNYNYIRALKLHNQMHLGLIEESKLWHIYDKP